MFQQKVYGLEPVKNALKVGDQALAARLAEAHHLPNDIREQLGLRPGLLESETERRATALRAARETEAAKLAAEKAVAEDIARVAAEKAAKEKAVRQAAERRRLRLAGVYAELQRRKLANYATAGNNKSHRRR